MARSAAYVDPELVSKRRAFAKKLAIASQSSRSPLVLGTRIPYYMTTPSGEMQWRGRFGPFDLVMASAASKARRQRWTWQVERDGRSLLSGESDEGQAIERVEEALRGLGVRGP